MTRNDASSHVIYNINNSSVNWLQHYKSTRSRNTNSIASIYCATSCIQQTHNKIVEVLELELYHLARPSNKKLRFLCTLSFRPSFLVCNLLTQE